MKKPISIFPSEVLLILLLIAIACCSFFTTSWGTPHNVLVFSSIVAVYALKNWTLISIRFELLSIKKAAILIGIGSLAAIWYILGSDVFRIFEIKQVYASIDYFYYAKLTKFFSDFGREALYYDWFFPETSVYAPYHYGEIWLNTLVHRIGSSSTQTTLICIVYPIIFVLAYFAWVENIQILIPKKSIFTYALLALAILSFSFIGLVYPNVGFLKGRILILSIFNAMKYLPIYAFTALIVKGFLLKQPIRIALIGGVAMLWYQPLAPVFTLVFGAYFAYLWYQTKSFKSVLPIVWFCIAGVLLLVTVVFANAHLPEHIKVSRDFEFAGQFLNADLFKTRFNIFVKTHIQMLFLCLPILILFAFERRISFYLVLGILGINSIGIAFWSIAYPNQDATQLWTVVLPIISSLSAFYLVYVYISSRYVLSKIVALVVLLFSHVHHFGRNPDGVNIEYDLRNDQFESIVEVLRDVDFVGIDCKSPYLTRFDANVFVWGIAQLEGALPDTKCIPLNTFTIWEGVPKVDSTYAFDCLKLNPEGRFFPNTWFSQNRIFETMDTIGIQYIFTQDTIQFSDFSMAGRYGGWYLMKQNE